jgi:hypothetical protein
VGEGGPSSLCVCILFLVLVFVEGSPFPYRCSDKLANQDPSWMLSRRRPRDACTKTQTLTNRQVAVGVFDVFDVVDELIESGEVGSRKIR